jgi:ribosomal protein S18 acetylase RimI-like enzyme
VGPGEFLRNHFRLFRLWILERSIRDACVGLVTPPAGVTIEFLAREARRDWICSHASEMDWPQFRSALQHDHDLVVATRNGETLGWAWIGYESVFLTPLGRQMQLPTGTAYLYEAYVRPSARRRGVGTALVAARCRRAVERQCDRLLTHVVEGNTPSLRALQVHGFEITGRTHFLKALALRVWTRSPLPAASAASAV